MRVIKVTLTPASYKLSTDDHHYASIRVPYTQAIQMCPISTWSACLATPVLRQMAAAALQGLKSSPPGI